MSDLQPPPKRSLWTQEMLDDYASGPHYDGGASARPPGLTKDEYRAVGRTLFENAAKSPAGELPIVIPRIKLIDEVSETPTYIEIVAPRKVPLDSELPTSPKSAMNAALRMGWDVNVWVSTGYIQPVLFVNASEEGSKNPHEAGSVRFPGYQVASYAVEALDRHMGALGFQAYYQGREPGKASFDYARVADPAGLLMPLSYDYPPIAVKRGADAQGRVSETVKSFEARERASVAQSERLQRDNNGGTHWVTRKMFGTAAGFTAWLREWKEMTNA